MASVNHANQKLDKYLESIEMFYKVVSAQASNSDFAHYHCDGLSGIIDHLQRIKTSFHIDAEHYKAIQKLLVKFIILRYDLAKLADKEIMKPQT